MFIKMPANLDRRRSGLIPLITRTADRHGLPAAIADAVIRVESSYNEAAVGGVGEVGLMQVRPSTAAMLGFRGTNDELAKPGVNLDYGIRYLAQAWRLANGDLCRALMKYRAGHGEDYMSPLSVEYGRRARLHLAAVAAGVSEPAPKGAVFQLPGAKESSRPDLRPASPPVMGKPGTMAAGSVRGRVDREHPIFAQSRASALQAHARLSVMRNRAGLLHAHRASTTVRTSPERMSSRANAG